MSIDNAIDRLKNCHPITKEDKEAFEYAVKCMEFTMDFLQLGATPERMKHAINLLNSLEYALSNTETKEELTLTSIINKKDNIIDDRIQKALNIAWDNGTIDGDWHKMWVIDQMVRALCGSEEEYNKWVMAYEKPLEDGDCYKWEYGIAP